MVGKALDKTHLW